MTTKKIVFAIVGAMLVAGCTQAVAYFPQLSGVLTAAAGLITALVAFVNGEDNQEGI